MIDPEDTPAWLWASIVAALLVAVLVASVIV